jgi:hypothetical protein
MSGRWVYKKDAWVASAKEAGNYFGKIQCPKCRVDVPSEGRLWSFLQRQNDTTISVINKTYNKEKIRVVSGKHVCGVELEMVDDSIESHHFKLYLDRLI